MNKKIAFLTIVLLVAISIGSIFALISAQKISTPQISSQNQPDYYMLDAKYTDYDQNGDIHSQISTSKITHFVTEDSYLFDNPIMIIFNQEQKPWSITSNKGKSEHGKEKVFLWDNVVIHQDAGPKNAPTTITTSELTIFPKTKTATTDKAVNITQGGSSITAVGANADFKTGVVNLLSQVQGKYIKSN